VKKANAELQVAASKVAINDRLNERTKGAVSLGEQRLAESELNVAKAALEIAADDRLEIEVRIRQTERRLNALLAALKEGASDTPQNPQGR
jgi:hypothetical protein